VSSLAELAAGAMAGVATRQRSLPPPRLPWHLPNGKLEFNNALDVLFDQDDATELLRFLSTCTLPE
jgi:hypothetical protein